MGGEWAPLPHYAQFKKTRKVHGKNYFSLTLCICPSSFPQEYGNFKPKDYFVITRDISVSRGSIQSFLGTQVFPCHLVPSLYLSPTLASTESSHGRAFSPNTAFSSKTYFRKLTLLIERLVSRPLLSLLGS